MKMAKKLSTLCLTLALILSLSISAFAAEPTSPTLANFNYFTEDTEYFSIPILGTTERGLFYLDVSLTSDKVN